MWHVDESLWRKRQPIVDEDDVEGGDDDDDLHLSSDRFREELNLTTQSAVDLHTQSNASKRSSCASDCLDSPLQQIERVSRRMLNRRKAYPPGTEGFARMVSLLH